MTKTRRNLLIFLTVVVAAVLTGAAIREALPVFADSHIYPFYLECNQRKVIESDSYTATVVSVRNLAGNQRFKSRFSTEAGTATGADYVAQNNVQVTAGWGSERLNRTFETKRDSEVEPTETYTILFNTTDSNEAIDDPDDPDRDNKCTIKIIDNDTEITLSKPRWGSWYAGGETIEFTARFGEAVTWNVDNKTLEFKLGHGSEAETKTAEYISGKGTNQIKFGYTVEADDLDHNGIYVGSNAIKGGDLKNISQDIFFTPRNAENDYPYNLVDGGLPDVSTGIPTSFKPWGIAVDDDTLYLSASKVDGSDYQLAVWAYDFDDTTGGVYGRDSDKDFGFQTFDSWGEVRGIYLSDNRLYVAEPHRERVPGYSLDGDWSHSWRNRVKTHSGEQIEGIWADTSDADNKRLYVASRTDGSIRAYGYPGDGNTINHDGTRKIELHSDNTWPRGIWSNGAVIWVADSADSKLYAYAFVDGLGGDGSRGDRLPDSDIELHRANSAPRGIWSDGRRFYVVDNYAKRVFRYPYNNATPDKPANVVATATSSSEITLTWDAPTDVGSSAIVSYTGNYRTVGAASWQQGFAQLANLPRSFDFTGLTANTAYEFQVFAENSHGVGVDSDIVSATTHAAVNQAPECSRVLHALTVTVGQDFRSLPPFSCSDPENETLTWSATLADDSALPAWLSFATNDAWMTGTPANDDAAGGDLSIKVTATDPHGLSDGQTFTLQMRGYQAPSNDAPTVVSAIADQNVYIGDDVNLIMTGTITDPEDGNSVSFDVDKPNPAANWLEPGLDSGNLVLKGTVPETMTLGTVISITVYGIDNANQEAEYTFSITSLGPRSTGPTPVNPITVAPIITEPVEFGDFVIMRQGPGYICGDPNAEYIVILAVKVDPPADGTTLDPDSEGFVAIFTALFEAAKMSLAEDETVADIDLDELEEQALEATYAKHWKFNDKVAEFGNEFEWPTTISQKVILAYYHNGSNEYGHYAHDHGRSFEF